MDFERAIDTQRFRLLRIVAGLLVAVGLLSVGPVSRRFSLWACHTVESVLSRAEAAAQYLVIAKARILAAQRGGDWGRSQFFASSRPAVTTCEAVPSLPDLRRRLRALKFLLTDLPQHAERLLRRIDREIRGAGRARRRHPQPLTRVSTRLCRWRLAGDRIERPPDHRKRRLAAPLSLPPASGRKAQAV